MLELIILGVGGNSFDLIDIIDELNKIYESVPSGDCTGCGNCCMESVGINLTEFLNIYDYLSKNDELLNAFASKKVVANKNDRSLNLPDITERALSGNKRNGSNIMFGHFEVE